MFCLNGMIVGWKFRNRELNNAFVDILIKIMCLSDILSFFIEQRIIIGISVCFEEHSHVQYIKISYNNVQIANAKYTK